MELLAGLSVFAVPFGIVVLIYLSRWLRVFNEYERGVVFRLGRTLNAPLGPGLKFLIAPGFIDKMVKIDMRTVALDVPTQDVITQDNISIKVNAVVYYKVTDPVKAVTAISDFRYATSQMAQTTLRSVLGQCPMDQLLSHRDEINLKIKTIVDDQTEPWGIEIANVEVKDIDLPETMQRAMARQAEAERDRRAKIINAEGEFQASQKLVEAAQVMEGHPMAMQMRYLQTVVEVGSEKNTTIFFPIPMDLIQNFTDALKSRN